MLEILNDDNEEIKTKIFEEIYCKETCINIKNDQCNCHEISNEMTRCFPLYTTFSRIETQVLKSNISVDLINQAIKSNRYYHYYKDLNGNVQEEGIDSASGPKGFNMKNFDKKGIDIDQFESTYIIDYLVTINKLLEKYNIKTVQSGIAYYNDVDFFSEPYLQLPFVEFSGDKNAIPVMKKIIKHPLFQNYYSSSYCEYHNIMRLAVLRPYIDSNGNKITEFDDTSFWNNIVYVIQQINTENIPFIEITNNDKELDKTKNWYILNQYGDITKISNKNKFNPFTNVPLSTLNVRYEPNIELFKKNI